ncbi:pentapeptide repeat-containing protein [Fodinicola feengrottensis]|uniref:Pentapeptide repeat-containing protein n=1 Tax=Fodinicola feengrottensis TaxID=435914 RepID=A0ABN2FVL9_9ACTN
MPARRHGQESEPLPEKSELRADCASCFGLCCVALTFAKSADFGIDKRAGEPCPNLADDFRCGIHQDLRPRGFAGCTVYDCFGAGQKISQETFGGKDWRQAPETAGHMFALLPVMRQLHELLWYLAEARELEPARSLRDEIVRGYDETERLTHENADVLMKFDVAEHRQGVNVLLVKTSELVRANAGRKKKDRSGADLIGARLRNADLRGANLRGAYLIGADLGAADLRLADLIGADVRDADLRGADLTGSIFLTQSQVNAARGDARTRLPGSVSRPGHWSR